MQIVLFRILQAIPTLFVVGTVVFITMRIIPGDPARVVLGENATDEQLSEYRAANGLDRPLLLQYVQWLIDMLSGNFGRSYVLDEPVSKLIAAQAFPTIANALLALAIVLVLGIPIGVYSATKVGSFRDKFVSGAAALSGTIPSFVMSLLLIAVFAVALKALPSGGFAATGAGFAETVSHMILPATALALTQLGYMVRMVRSSVIDELSQSYVLAQRARGYGVMKSVRRALRNAAVPLLTVSGQSLGLMVAGSVIIETVFTISGLGQLTINAISRSDFALLAGVVMFISVIVISINLVVDIACSILDPRLRRAQ